MASGENAMSTACQNMEQDLVLYYYRELESADEKAVQLHLENCSACRGYLQNMTALLPLTVLTEEPTEAFWDSYNREMRQKLAQVKEKKTWWHSLISLFQPWPVPAIAVVTVAALALTITLGKGFRSASEIPSNDQDLIEVLPLAENLDFFKNMEVLDSMDFLEQMGGSGGTT
jgi:predicted anti-sigma-YlaC factor YlaD